VLPRHFVLTLCPYSDCLGFDPLGFKPADAASFNQLATKELNNGRLAMIAAAGFLAQELVSGKEVFVSLGLSPDTFDPSSLPVQF
jgi:Chlorophyll A-B binding protein